ncbi:MAG: hypothetical protein LQ352_005442 [Teloschistes flavicans]|nr:MAG: hypothetical protein LQ352_005442 [Teloschistes flavicans]
MDALSSPLEIVSLPGFHVGRNEVRTQLLGDDENIETARQPAQIRDISGAHQSVAIQIAALKANYRKKRSWKKREGAAASMLATGDRRMFQMKQADGHKWQLKGNWIRMGTLTSSGEDVWLYGVGRG